MARAGRRGASLAQLERTAKPCRAGCGRDSCRPGASSPAAARLIVMPSTSTGAGARAATTPPNCGGRSRSRATAGRLRTVQRWACGRRGADPTASGVGRGAAAWPVPSKQRTAWLVVADPERMNATEQRFVDDLIARSPELAVLISLAREFSSMVRQQQTGRLDGWLDAVKGSALAGFAGGLTRDLAAVRAALSLPWSTGPVEGQISRLKMIKRAMCGRAGFELLRQRIL